MKSAMLALHTLHIIFHELLGTSSGFLPLPPTPSLSVVLNCIYAMVATVPFLISIILYWHRSYDLGKKKVSCCGADRVSGLLLFVWTHYLHAGIWGCAFEEKCETPQTFKFLLRSPMANNLELRFPHFLNVLIILDDWTVWAYFAKN